MHSTNQVSFHQIQNTQPEDKKLKHYLASIGITHSYNNKPTDYTRLQPVIEQKPVTMARPTPPVVNLNVPQKNHPTIKSTAIADQVNQCQSIQELFALLDTYHDCDLRKTATNTVFADGIPHAPIMVIGEAPGAEEDALGKPFVGKSGQLVDNMFKAIGLSRQENIYISNIVFWRPPGNRPPTQIEIDQCRPFILKHIALARPKILVLLGGVAAKTILESKETIIQLRGKIHHFHHTDLSDSLPVFSFYHPAYLLRSPRQKGAFWHDLLHLKEYMDQAHILPPTKP
ncbi:MAG: uracil-DNA glycosylase [Alphaproteobacteria bacterium]|nr:uracil-DNA glycosylase [Alphaproteobacteria bacterium]